MFALFENDALYSMIEASRHTMQPFRYLVRTGKAITEHPMNPMIEFPMGRTLNASLEIMERLTRQYHKPEFGIHHITMGDKDVHIRQKTLMSKPFCRLLHFEKDFHRQKKKVKQPKLLIVAPLSGHFSTLLRGTVKDTLPHFDVYITDWINASEIPQSEGTFDLDDHINYCIEFMEHLGPDVHVMAVCQPTVPVLAAISIMAANHSKSQPKSMILIGGPIDARKNPTEVNKYADNRHMNWFETQVITRVPMNYPGAWRLVYPGFIQLAGFMSMNMQRHVGEHMKLFQHLVIGDGESAQAHRTFYNEYLSVMDIPAEFYLQTIETVFKEYSLPKGTMVSRGRAVHPADIKKTALLVIEGELDDISGIGQTKAAIDLCKNIPKSKKTYHLQKGVGHYGTFNGRRFREQIVPFMEKFIKKYDKPTKKRATR